MIEKGNNPLSVAFYRINQQSRKIKIYQIATFVLISALFITVTNWQVEVANLQTKIKIMELNKTPDVIRIRR